MGFSNKVLIFGGTGSLGKTLMERLVTGYEIVVFSRDEAKHHLVQQEYPYVQSIIGDIRNYDSVKKAIKEVQPYIIINAAAMKQVPTCEFFPFEAIRTNTLGTHNLVRAVHSVYPGGGVKVLSISTDKACKPVNSYGMTKALQERIHLNGNGQHGVFNCVRYGNVLESTGSVIPVYKKILSDKNKVLQVTHLDMTRFFMSLNDSVDLILTALSDGIGGKIFIPKVRAGKIMDLAKIMRHHAGDPNRPIQISGIRPGEKLDEILISEEEIPRVEDLGDVFVVHDIKKGYQKQSALSREYSSADALMSYEELEHFLVERGAL